jgi:hypothetical protein
LANAMAIAVTSWNHSNYANEAVPGSRACSGGSAPFYRHRIAPRLGLAHELLSRTASPGGGQCVHVWRGRSQSSICLGIGCLRPASRDTMGPRRSVALVADRRFAWRLAATSSFGRFHEAPSALSADCWTLRRCGRRPGRRPVPEHWGRWFQSWRYRLFYGRGKQSRCLR